MDPYRVLGVSPSATDDEVKKAYKLLAKKYHPDMNVGAPNIRELEARFKQVQAAYTAIMDQRQGKGQGFFGQGFGQGYGQQSGGYRQQGNPFGQGYNNQQRQSYDEWYRRRSQGYQRPSFQGNNWCLSLILLNLLCNCCCRPC